MGFLALCCQCITWPGIFLASCSQIGTFPYLVHPWRLRSVYYWWWDRESRGDTDSTWWGNVYLVLIICRLLTLLIFNDIVLYWGDRFSPPWLHFLRYNSVFFLWLLLWRVCCALHIIGRIGKYLGKFLYCDYLGVTDVGKWRLRFWVFQGVGSFTRRDDDIFWRIIVGEWSIMWEKLNTNWF